MMEMEWWWYVGKGGTADRGLCSFSHPTGNTVVVT